ncbi:MAG: ParA family protein [Gammaproteobacteria bacterium]|nr:ParA family protein [Gammaproteobacteria bacterium]
MQKILVINPKGGCGKSTISAQLAGYYANWGMRVALADTDPQKSSLNWLRIRPLDAKTIIGINAIKERIVVPDGLDYLIIDTAAGFHENDFRYLAELCDNILIPVLPSAMDTHAASHFAYQLLIKYRITFEDKKICVIANRTRLRSIAYRDLLSFLDTLKLPLITTIRESKHYIDCTATGLSIFDTTKSNTSNLRKDWLPVIRWLYQTKIKKTTNNTKKIEYT